MYSHFVKVYFDLLKMQQAFWGGVEVSYRRTPGQLHLVGQSRSTVNRTARMLYSFIPLLYYMPIVRHIDIIYRTTEPNDT